MAGVKVQAIWNNNGQSMTVEAFTDKNGHYAIFGGFGKNAVELTGPDIESEIVDANGKNITINLTGR
jgi:hypothetical protein